LDQSAVVFLNFVPCSQSCCPTVVHCGWLTVVYLTANGGVGFHHLRKPAVYI